VGGRDVSGLWNLNKCIGGEKAGKGQSTLGAVSPTRTHMFWVGHEVPPPKEQGPCYCLEGLLVTDLWDHVRVKDERRQQLAVDERHRLWPAQQRKGRARG
jgi:hypothetical protein